MQSWSVVEKFSLNCLDFYFREEYMDRARRRGWDRKTSFYFFIFFVNKFVQCFTIIIIKCKALFSCHSSSSHYSTQGFILISFHFIFSFLKK